MRKFVTTLAALSVCVGAFAQTFSFELDGKKKEYKVATKSYTDKSGLKVECTKTVHEDFGVEEWVLRFTNTGKANSPVISNLKVMNDVTAGSDWTLHHMKGTQFTAEDFLTYTEKLGSEPFHLAPREHRSSASVFPFFRLASPQMTKIYAIGWTGYWESTFQIEKNNLKTVISAPYLEAYLEPGESIRTAAIVMMTCPGNDERAAQNKFKKFMQTYHHPHVNGEPAHYPTSCSFNFGEPYPYSEYSANTTKYSVALIERYQMFNLLGDAFWLDAGWYGNCSHWQDGFDWSNSVGSWYHDTDRYPNGLGDIADAIHEVGGKFILWFEPERAWDGSSWLKEHPEYYINIEGCPNHLYNMADPQAVDYLCQSIDLMVKEYKVDIYRQDYNITPDPYYEVMDGPGRKGITESHYIEGLYKYWDYLIKNNPGLIIDNCASGGHRLDVETFSRSAPLWRSDYSGHPESNQTQTYGLQQWVPSTGTGVYDEDLYSCRSGYSSAMIFNWKVTGPGGNNITKRAIMDEYAEIKPYYEKDFYPLTPEENGRDHKSWVAYQLMDPDTQVGYVCAFRRPECEQPELVVCLGGLDAEKTYLVESKDGLAPVELTGAQLAKGFSIKLENARQSAIFKLSAK